MPRPTGPTDPNMLAVISKLKKNKEYSSIVKNLSRPRRSKNAVNVGKLEKIGKNSPVIVVPGKVLGVGSLSKPVTVYAWHFSKQAKEKIEKAGGRALSLEKLTEEKQKARIVI
jgi:large subunit ribosomal protein L18e